MDKVKQRGCQAEEQLEPLFFRCSPGVNALSLNWTDRAAGVKIGKIRQKEGTRSARKATDQILLESQTEPCLPHQSEHFIIPDITVGV